MYLGDLKRRTDMKWVNGINCLKIVRIRSYSSPHFPEFGVNNERDGVSLRIQYECRKMLTRITPNTDTFYAVISITLTTTKITTALMIKTIIKVTVTEVMITK